MREKPIQFKFSFNHSKIINENKTIEKKNRALCFREHLSWNVTM